MEQDGEAGGDERSPSRHQRAGRARGGIAADEQPRHQAGDDAGREHEEDCAAEECGWLAQAMPSH